jgi:glycosyltransferase involved in cell wall biosynthesis
LWWRLLHNTEFLSVLGFDLAWDPAYYEDVDLCLKLRLIGLQTFYCPQSTVTHIEGATSSDTSHNLSLNNIIAINKAKFCARWGAFLQSSGVEKPNLIPFSPEPIVRGTGKPQVAIFTPYNITPGGGERYFLTIAESFRGLAEVTLITPRPFSRTRILTMGRDFGLRLDHIDLVTQNNYGVHQQFDLAFVIGNEILPPIGGIATHNIFICQFPFPFESENQARHARPYWDDYDLVLTYSSFVRRHVTEKAESFRLPSLAIEILAPPVPLLEVGLKTRARILHVGRFFTGGHCKRQDVLIGAFRRLIESGVEAELHLAGSTHPEPEHRAYYSELVESALGLPVYFHANCSAGKLRELYMGSAIYWHATGFGDDVELEPYKTEHFGISVVEAMSAGCIPVVFAAGGPAEVVEDNVTGFHFRTIGELCTITQKLIEDTSSREMSVFANAAAEAARFYDESVFKAHVRTLAARFFSFSGVA